MSDASYVWILLSLGSLYFYFNLYFLLNYKHNICLFENNANDTKSIQRRQWKQLPAAHTHPLGPSSQSDHESIWNLCDNQKKSSLPLWGCGHIPGPWMGRRQIRWKEFFLHTCARQVSFCSARPQQRHEATLPGKTTTNFYLFPMCLQALVMESPAHRYILYTLECLSFFLFVLNLNTTTWIVHGFLSSLWLHSTYMSIFIWPCPWWQFMWTHVSKMLPQWLFLYV